MHLDNKIRDFVSNSLKWNSGFITKISKLNGLNNFNYKMNYLGMDYFISLKGPSFSKECLSTYTEVLALTSSKNISYKVVHLDKDNGNLLTHWIDGEIPNYETLNSDRFINSLCTSLKKFHSLKVCNMKNPFESIIKRYNSCIEKNISFPFDISDLIQKSICIDKKYSKNKEIGLCHYDLNPSNIIYDGNKCYIIDLEFSSMGDIFWDIASITYMMDSTSKEIFMKCYFGNLSNKIFEKLNDYYFGVMLWNALWNLLKSYDSNSTYNYAKAGEIILMELKNGKWN